MPEGHTEAGVTGWVSSTSAVRGLRRRARRGHRAQHHDDLLKTAAQTLAVVEQIDSECHLAPQACTWQLKERVGVAEALDVAKIVRILRDTGYRGYLPLETLGAGDPRPKLRSFLDRVRGASA